MRRNTTPRHLIVDSLTVIPGRLPDRTPMAAVQLESANLGVLEWYMTPGVARNVAAELQDYADEWSR